LNATSTHDTKRSEDVRARIDVLSEITDEWTENAKSWSAMNADLKTQVNGASVPDPDMELLIYQSMLGAWPLCDSEIDGFQERLKAYVIKAGREAKSATSWTKQNVEVEGALLRFVDGLFAPSQSARFMESFQQLQRTVAFYGAVNSLSQVLLKAASPGVPDFYQGSELWDFSLVDPDNRRPVDFAARSKLLAELQSVATRDENLPSRLMRDWTDGRIKLFLTWKALAARREHPLLFSDGEYIPLEVTGGRSGHAVAFARRTGAAYVVAIAPRLSVALCRPQVFPLGGQVWGDTAVRLPTGAPGTWVNLLTGDVISLSHQTGRLLVGDTLARFPVALLLGTGDDIPKSAGQPYG
jgi:(1->4)-alpha-D-glucan 1-alpha-D-glucosylmutase